MGRGNKAELYSCESDESCQSDGLHKMRNDSVRKGSTVT